MTIDLAEIAMQTLMISLHSGLLFDFEVNEISAQEIDDVSVSSTKIRNALAAGDIKTANAYLGYNYMLTGTIIKGKGPRQATRLPNRQLIY